MQFRNPFARASRATMFGVIFSLSAATSAAAQPSFSTSFSPTAIGTNSLSQVSYVISNPTGSPITQLAFSNTLPAGLVVASAAQTTSNCGGTFSATAGSSVIQLAGGSIGGNSSCSMTVNVTAAAAGLYQNTTSDLTSSAGNSGSANADLTVDAGRPGFSKSFSPNPVFFGNPTTITYTIDNTANADNAVNLRFTDNLPFGLIVGNPALASTTCSGGTLTANPGSSTISYAPLFFGDASVAAGASCTVTARIDTGTAGSLESVSGELTSNAPSNFTAESSGSAGAVLDVLVESISLNKSFVDDPVAPGGMVTLRYTMRNLSRSGVAASLSFTDDLDSALSGLFATNLPLSDVCGVGSSVSGTGNVAFANGSLLSGESCSFDVQLEVPTGATPGTYSSTTSNVSGNIDGNAVGGGPAVDSLVVSPAPQLSKSYADPVSAGAVVTLTYTLTNTSTTASLQNASFSDVFPGIIQTAAATPATGFCGSGSQAQFAAANTFNPSTLTVTGANLAAGASCSFTLDLNVNADAASGSYRHTSSDVSGTVDGSSVTGNGATDSLDVIAAPELLKEFIDDPAQPGGQVTLQYIISNGSGEDDGLAQATNISFSDDLDAALTGLIATGTPLSNVCGAGSTLSGSQSLLLTGGNLAGGESCTFNVVLNVPASASSGTFSSTSSAVVADVSGVSVMSPPATADLRIAGIASAKSFVNDPVPAGATVTLEYTLENLSPDADATGIVFTDNLGDALSGLTATGLPINDICGVGSSLSAVSGNSLLFFQGGSLSPQTSCTFSVDLSVPANAEASTYTSASSAVQATINGQVLIFDPITDQLVINAELLAIAKAFLNGPATAGGTVDLEFTLTNLDGTSSADSVSFTDDLGALLPGMQAVGLPLTACGGTASGTDVITFSGGTLAAGSSCTFSVTVSIPSDVTPGTLITNVTSDITGNVAGVATSGDPATAPLVINSASLTKAFDGTATAGGTAQLTFSISNLSSSSALADLSFIDDLDAALPGMTALGLPAQDICGTGSSLTGSSLITLSGGNLLPSGSCTFSVEVTVPASTPPGSYVNTTTDLRLGGAVLGNTAASAVLTVISTNDSDNDGVTDNEDLCPGTVIPEGVPTQHLKVNRYALVDDDFEFDTVAPPGGGRGPDEVFTTTDTGGCSCEQIIEALDLGEGQRKFGCSLGVIRDFIFGEGFED